MAEEDRATLGQTLERVVGEAIQAAVAQHETAFVTRWVALVESVDATGARGLWTMTSDDVTAWDTVGLLQHGLHMEQAAVVADRLTRPDEDDD